MNKEESEALGLLLEIFGWTDSLETRFNAYVILRKARGESPPSWDDFKLGIRR